VASSPRWVDRHAITSRGSMLTGLHPNDRTTRIGCFSKLV
jgi:hypothetical protein